MQSDEREQIVREAGGEPTEPFQSAYQWTGQIVQEKREKRNRDTWRGQQDEERKAKRILWSFCILGGFLLLVLAGAQIYAWWRFR